MRRLRSLRVHIAVWSALIFTAGMTVLIGLMWLEAREGIAGVLDAILRDRLQQYSAQLQQSPRDALPQLASLMGEPRRDTPAGLIVEIRIDGRRVSSSAANGLEGGAPIPWPEVSTSDAPVSETVTLASGSLYHAAGVRLRHTSPTLDAFVAAPLGPVADVLGRLRSQLLWLVPAVIVLSAMGGYWVSGLALTPIRRVVAAAQSTNVRHLSARVVVPDTGDAIEELARTFNDMLDRIEQPVRRQEEFVADASHELRTPLAAIQNTAELALERPRTGDAYREALDDVLRESRSLSRMVEQLLVLARADAGEPLAFARVDMKELCAEVAGDCAVLLTGRNKRFRLVLARQELIVLGHADRLRRLITILLDNAMNYTDVGAEIVLRSGTDQDRPFIEVSDTGVGIASEDLPRIFDRFYRVDRARSRATQSFGLGLAIAKSITQSHRADILVTSRLGHGSTFRVWFAGAEEIGTSGTS